MKVWYMRDNHMFVRLSADTGKAKQQIAEQFGLGYRHGMLCSKDAPLPPVHAQGDLQKFLAQVDEFYQKIIDNQRGAYI